MKALTIWQPWASLLACRVKQFETRSWYTSYRGPIAIHAVLTFKNTFPEDFATAAHEALKISLPDFTHMHELPRGAVIATAALVGCHKIVRFGGRGLSNDGPGWLDTGKGIYEPTENELLFGDWTPGRYALEFSDMKMITTSPVKGRQGLWTWGGQP